MINNKTIYYIGNLFFINFLQTHTQIENTSRRHKKEKLKNESIEKGKGREKREWKSLMIY